MNKVSDYLEFTVFDNKGCAGIFTLVGLKNFMHFMKSDKLISKNDDLPFRFFSDMDGQNYIVRGRIR